MAPPERGGGWAASGGGIGALSAADRAAQAFLRQKLAQSGHEWLRAVDEATGIVLVERTDGETSRVRLDRLLAEAARDPGRRIAVHHSHPGNSALSLADLNALVALPGMTAMGAHGPTASYVARRSAGEVYAAADWGRRATVLDFALSRDLNRHVRDGRIGDGEAGTLRPWLRQRALAADGYLDLVAEGDDVEQAIFRRLGRRGPRIIARAIAGLRKRGL